MVELWTDPTFLEHLLELYAEKNKTANTLSIAESVSNEVQGKSKRNQILQNLYVILICGGKELETEWMFIRMAQQILE